MSLTSGTLLSWATLKLILVMPGQVAGQHLLLYLPSRDRMDWRV